LLYHNCSTTIFSDYVFSLTTFFKKKFKARVFKINPTSVEQHQNCFKVQQK